jgi:RHS repeat-associated protein
MVHQPGRGRFGHYPFGETWYEAGKVDKWKFTTYERDAESGLDYAMFRYDSTRLGRFMTPDPVAGTILDPQTLNRYSYVLNNPVNFIDPLGLCTVPGTGQVVPCPDITTILVTAGILDLFGGAGGAGGHPAPFLNTGSEEGGAGGGGESGCIPRSQLSRQERIALWLSQWAARLRGGIQGFGAGGSGTARLPFLEKHGTIVDRIGGAASASRLFVSTPQGQSFRYTSIGFGVGYRIGGVAGIQYLSSPSPSVAVLQQSSPSVGVSNARGLGGGLEVGMDYVLVTLGLGGGRRGFVVSPGSDLLELRPICDE